MYLKIEKRALEYKIINLYFGTKDDAVTHDEVAEYIEEQTKEIFEDVYRMEFDAETMGKIGLGKLLACATYLKVIEND